MTKYQVAIKQKNIARILVVGPQKGKIHSSSLTNNFDVEGNLLNKKQIDMTTIFHKMSNEQLL